MLQSLSLFFQDDKTPLQDAPTWALVLALSICYHARLQDRNDFGVCGVVNSLTLAEQMGFRLTGQDIRLLR